MKRRQAISRVGLLAGGVVISAPPMLTGCKSEEHPASGILDQQKVRLVDEIGEVILPATPDSPGAKEANVGATINLVLTDCSSLAEQRLILNGLMKLENLSDLRYERTFLQLSDDQKKNLLMELEKQSAEYKRLENQTVDTPDMHYYKLLKQLILWSYFTSEIGATKALAHVPIPGRYQGCIALKEGQKAWS